MKVISSLPLGGDNHRRVIAAQLGMTAVISFLRIGTLETERSGKLLCRHRHQFVIITAGHIHINVIVPRNKSLMTDGSEKRTAIQCHLQPVFITYFHEPHKHVQLDVPHLFHLGGNGIAPTDFRFRIAIAMFCLHSFSL